MTDHNAGGLSIRPATPADLPAIADLLNAVWPGQEVTVQGLRQQEDDQNASLLPLVRGRLLAEHDGRAVGFAEYEQYPGMYHPQKFCVAVNVRPGDEGRGVGRALSGRLWEALVPYRPVSLLGETREDRPRGLAFLARQGFTEAMRFYELRLDVPAFEFARFTVQEALPEGYLLTSYAELGQTGATQRRIYALWAELRADVPHPEPQTPVPFEGFVRRLQGNPYLLPAGYLLALHRESGELAALTELYTSDGAHLNVGLTGVKRSHRRKGLALALKLAAIRYAAGLGVPELRTGNASHNEGMLSINAALGFVKQPALIELRWEAAQWEAVRASPNIL